MMKNLSLTFVTLFTLLMMSSLASCQDTKTQSGQANPGSTGINEVLNPAQFWEKYQSLEGAQLVDVRTPGETAQGIIEGAGEVDFRQGDFSEKIAQYDKEKPIFLYCRSGRRSASAANMLGKMGFKEVYDLKGGMLSWQAKGMPVSQK
jgi:rhodanese-related sulfurtransferase